MNLKAIYNSIVKDTRAVSPVVASLILVVVAVVGAATIGVMMGVVGEDVGEQADADQVGDASKAMIELAACGCGWDAHLRPAAVEFADANPGIGVLKHHISGPNILPATSMGVADVGVMSDNGRAFGFILQSKPSTDLLNASVNPAINDSIERINGTTVGGHLLNFGSPEYNGTRLLNLYKTFAAEPALIPGLMEAYPEKLMALLKLNADVQKVSGLKDHWNTYLIDLNLQEFRTRRDTFGTESFYFYTLEEPSPIESSFINYMRLKVFDA